MKPNNPLKESAVESTKVLDPVVELEIPAGTKLEQVTQSFIAKAWTKAIASETGRSIRAWYIARISWPISKRMGVVLCTFNRHHWEDAFTISPDGTPITSHPGQFKRCARPACRIYRDTPQLKVVNNPETGKPAWFEVSDEFEVIARVACPQCQGRGSSRRMLLPAPEGEKITVKMPCQCLKVQPRFILREEAKGRK